MRGFLQDLFTGWKPPAEAPMPEFQSKQPVPSVPRSSGAPVSGVSITVDDRPDSPWRHPRAQHQVQLGDIAVGYELRRRPRRSIGFAVHPEGLVVSAPRWVALTDIEAVLRARAGWILRQLGERQQRSERLAAVRLDWADGARLPYLGGTLRLALAGRPPGRGRAAAEWVVLATSGPGPDASGGPALELRLPLEARAEAAVVRAAAQAALQQRARWLFAQRLDHYAPQLGVRWSRLSLSSAATRWGSARADGHIRLNWRLLHLPPALLDYVVVHELAHLHEMNHGPRFWAHVATVLPDHAERRRALRAAVVPRD